MAWCCVWRVPPERSAGNVTYGRSVHTGAHYRRQKSFAASSSPSLLSSSSHHLNGPTTNDYICPMFRQLPRMNGSGFQAEHMRHIETHLHCGDGLAVTGAGEPGFFGITLSVFQTFTHFLGGRATDTQPLEWDKRSDSEPFGVRIYHWQIIADR